MYHPVWKYEYRYLYKYLAPGPRKQGIRKCEFRDVLASIFLPREIPLSNVHILIGDLETASIYPRVTC
jgi:hypothetical protein